MDAYIDVLFRANEKTLKEANAMLVDTLFEICERNGWNSDLIEKGREKGFEQGREQAMAAIARNLLAEGSTPQFVQKITGLSLDEIEKL